MKKFYISGMITGIRDEAPALFQKAEIEVLDLDHDSINPMKLPENGEKSWSDFLRRDIKALCDCDGIYMLNNWRDSNGATLELHIAVQLGLDVIFQK